MIFTTRTTGWSVSVTKPELRALAAHAHKDPAKPHIHGVYFDPAAGWACATDGHRIAAVHAEPLTGAAPLIVPLPTVKALLKLPANEWTLDACGTATSPGHTIQFTAADEQFPPYGQFLKHAEPAKSPAPAFGMDVRYLADLKLVVDASEDTREGYCVAVVTPATKSDPAVFTVGLWTVVIMPAQMGAVDKAHEKARAA